MSEPLQMTLQERMAVLSFTCKSAEMLENNMEAATNPVNLAQWISLSALARNVLQSLDALPENDTLLPLPHDGVRWAERGGQG